MRTCPFTNCNAQLPDAMFACRRHWFALNRIERLEITDAYNAYMADKIGLEELRARQQAILGQRGNARRSDDGC